MPGLAGALALVGEERRLVHEEVGSCSGVDHGRRRRGVAREHDRPAGARLAEHIAGETTRPSASVTALAALELPAFAAVGHAEARRLVDVETSGPLVLDHGVADRGDPMVDVRNGTTA